MEQVEAIQVNITTKDEIIEIFGVPQQLTLTSTGAEIFTYIHATNRSIGVPFLVSVGRAGTSGERLSISFMDEVVVDYTLTIDQLNIMFKSKFPE